MSQESKLEYPKTKKIDHIDDYHGTKVADPYRWLEESADTPEVSAWIKEQNELTFSYLDDIPEREQIKNRLTELWDYPKQGAPFKKGNTYFQFRNTGLQNQAVLFVMNAADEQGKVLLDPNTLADDGTAALNNLAVSPDGQYLAYAVSKSGSDWQTWHIRNVETLTDLDEQLEWSKFGSVSWLPDCSGFYYGRYPAPKEGEEYLEASSSKAIFLHKLNQSAEQDVLIYENKDEPKWMPYVQLSNDSAYLILSISRDTRPLNTVFIKEINDEGDFRPLIPEYEAGFFFIGNDASTFYFQTNYEASRGQIIAVDVTQPQKSNWKTLIPESENTLQTTRLIHDQFICCYLQHASNILKRYTTKGEPLRDVELPTLGTVEAINSNRDDDIVFYSFTSFLYPTINFSYSLNTEKSVQLDETSLNFNAGNYETKQIFATSKDGTQVPVFVVHKKGLLLNSLNPALLYGYGGFNVSLTPSFSVSRLAWLELGGVLAVANLRGGGEYGQDWHKAGTVHQKQNVFDDFIACAEHLISQGYTSPQKLAVQGGSNGGLLVGACMTQRPELFGATLPAVGVMDMLRFHKFTIGWAWVGDFGSSDDPEQFEAILKYSPLHNLEPQSYPATLITTGDHDDRVVPGHSFKFAATLQEKHSGETPTLIRVQTNAGHGAGKPTSMLIQEQADIWGFLVKALKINTSN